MPQGFLAASFFMFGLFMYLLYADENSMQVLYVSEELFSQLTSQFDKFLKRKFLKHDESVRDLAIFDKSKMENQYQNWSKIYQTFGNRLN